MTTDTAPAAIDRVTQYLERRGMDRLAEVDVLHTYDAGLETRPEGFQLLASDISALAAELATARAERDEWKAAATAHHPNPADYRYWEGRYRDEAAEVAALRKEVERLRGDAQ